MSKVSSNAAFWSLGIWSMKETSPTSSMSTFDWVWLPSRPPKSTRNISGKTIAKNTDARSRMNPRMMARLRALKASSVVMRGTPVR